MTKPTVSHIGQTIKEVFEDMGRSKTTTPDKEAILSAWQKAAGHMAAGHSSPTALKNDTLLVNVDSAVWIYQLRLKQAGLIKNMSKLLKTQHIKKIRFRSGEIEDIKNENKKEKKQARR